MVTTYTGALTLGQYAVMSNEPLVRAVSYSLIEAGMAMQDIPFVNKQALIASGVRFEGNLPAPTWTPLNIGPTPVTGTPKPFQEQAFRIRNIIQVDKDLVRDQNQISEPRAIQVGAFLRGQAYDFNTKFIGNNHVSGDKECFVGLRARIDDGATYGVRSENKINAGAVDLSVAGMTAATFNSFLELVDQLLWSVGSPDGMGVVLYMNEVMCRRFDHGARKFSGQGGLSTGTDQLGRGITRYKNAIIRDIGYKSDQSTRIITTTETSAGADGASVHSSIYAAHYGTEWLYGWQFAGLDAQDLGLDQDGAIYRTLIEWTGGLFCAHTRAIARLYGIKLA